MALAAVFDTNILFSATGWRGAPFQCVERARSGIVRIVTCSELIEELAEKLETRLNFSAEQVATRLADYLSFIRVVRLPKVLEAVSRDPEDDMVLGCAIAGRAQYIVTGDNDLLVLKQFRGVAIVRAGDFLKIVDNKAAE